MSSLTSFSNLYNTLKNLDKRLDRDLSYEAIRENAFISNTSTTITSIKTDVINPIGNNIKIMDLSINGNEIITPSGQILINSVDIQNGAITGTKFIGEIEIPGSISGSTIIKSENNASGILTIPSTTDHLVGRNTIDILTNKTLINPIISGVSSYDIGNINISGNTISSTNTDGDIILSPNGNGNVVLNADISFGNINIDNNTISSTNTNGNIYIIPDGNGKVIINSIIDLNNLSITGNSIISNNTNGNIIFDPNGNGQVNITSDLQINGNITATSSIRYKENIRELDDLETFKIYKLVPVTYNRKGYTAIEYGFIAEQVEKLFPELIKYREIDGKLVPDALNYERLIVPLIGEFKRLQERITLLEKK